MDDKKQSELPEIGAPRTIDPGPAVNPGAKNLAGGPATLPVDELHGLKNPLDTEWVQMFDGVEHVFKPGEIVAFDEPSVHRWFLAKAEQRLRSGEPETSRYKLVAVDLKKEKPHRVVRTKPAPVQLESPFSAAQLDTPKPRPENAPPPPPDPKAQEVLEKARLSTMEFDDLRKKALAMKVPYKRGMEKSHLVDMLWGAGFKV